MYNYNQSNEIACLMRCVRIINRMLLTINNKSYDVSLERGKVYGVLDDEKAY